MATTTTTGKRKSLVGSIVGSGRMSKTVTVSIERLVKHPLYGKYIKRSVKYLAHDEKNVCQAGDKVMIVETRPKSRTKRWRVKEILEKAK